jgi:galactan endo-1,6-beta-galactosidase
VLGDHRLQCTGRTLPRFATVWLCVWSAIVLLPVTARAQYTVTIDPTITWGVWDGWGCSLCWWANVFGNRDDLADIVFATNYTILNGQNLPGLGLNIARYNAGACLTNAIDGSVMQVSSNIPPTHQMQGYWINWFSSDPGSTSWNWSADANQRAMLLKAKSRGANWLELFSNSPLWWMCYNHNPSGANNGANDNLQSWNYDQHAVYLATVAQYASAHWGVNFDSVEAFNEPVSTWWNAQGTQEGCHVANTTQADVIGYLRTELDNRGLSSVLVSASDDNTYDEATATWQSFSAAVQANVGRVNTHGYQYGGGRRDLLYAAVAGRQLWNSEYGENDATGLSLAGNLNLDFTWLHPTGWCYWQPFDCCGWGLINAIISNSWIGSANPKYFVLAQYTRHIRPGMTIIESGDGNSVTAYDQALRKLVIVTMNYGTPQTITYDLSNFPHVAGPVTSWTTRTSGQTEYAPLSFSLPNGKSFEAAFTTNTIETFEIQNVDLLPSLAASLDGTQRQVVFSWPDWATNYTLFYATNLTPPVQWFAVTNLPQESAGLFNLNLTVNAVSQRYFRLAAP